MNRAERRRQEKAEKKKVPTYNLNPDQIKAAIRQEMAAELQAAKDEAVNTALTLMLVLPLEVLMNHYWQKSYQKRLPGFVKLVLDYYAAWECGELDMEDLKRDLWEYGCIRLEESEGEP